MMYYGPLASGALHLGLLALALMPARPDEIPPMATGPAVEVELISAQEYEQATGKPPGGAEPQEPELAMAPPVPSMRPPSGVTIAAPEEAEPQPLPQEETPPTGSVEVGEAPAEPQLDERALLDEPVTKADIVPEDRVRVASAPDAPAQPKGVFDAPEVDTDPDEPPEPEETAEPTPQPAPSPEAEVAETVPRNEVPPDSAPLPRPKPRGSLAAKETDEEVAPARTAEAGDAAAEKAEPPEASDADRSLAEELLARSRETVVPDGPTDEEIAAEDAAIARREAEAEATRQAEEEARADAARREAEEALAALREREAEEAAERAADEERRRREEEAQAAREAAEEERRQAEQEERRRAEDEARERAEREERERQEADAARRALEEERRAFEAEQARLAEEQAAKERAERERAEREEERRAEAAARAAEDAIRREREREREIAALAEQQRRAEEEAARRRQQLEQFNAGAAPLPDTRGAGSAPSAAADPFASMLSGLDSQFGGGGGGGGSANGGSFTQAARQAQNAAPLTQGEQQNLLNQLSNCWRLGSMGGNVPVVTVRVQFSPDGRVVNQSVVSAPPGAALAVERATNALRDQGCQPFQMPRHKYASWQQLDIVFDPRRMSLQ